MRNQQNIFDNATFFQGYQLLRKNKFCANDVEEKPALFSLIPELKGKRVLDLGCGFGENCKKYAEMGAEYILGIDISEKMLEIARKENAHPQVEYRIMNMEDIHTLNDSFDVIISSLALHYICDFEALVKAIARVLKDSGSFIFTQEHPITTAPKDGLSWRMQDNQVTGILLTDYAEEGKREVSWFVDGVIKFHRRTDTILNTLIENGFMVERILEPSVPADIIKQEPILSRCLHTPDYLMVKAKKLPAEILNALRD